MKAFLFSILALLAVLIVAGLLWWQSLNANPVVAIPTPAMPSPNARDYFAAAGGALVRYTDVGVAVSSRTAASGGTRPAAPGARSFTLEQQEALVRANEVALRLLRKGFACPYLERPARSGTEAISPHYPAYRGLARLLLLDARVREARGDWAGAVRSRLDAIRIGEEITHGAPVIGELVGAACEAIGQAGLEDAAAHLSAAEARQAARELEAISARRGTFAETLLEEKRLDQALLMETFRTRDWRRALLTQAGPSGGSGGFLEGVTLKGRVYTASKKGLMRAYTDYMDRAIIQARQPYAVARIAPLPPTEPLLESFAAVGPQARFLAERIRAIDDLLLVELVLRAYRLERGTYPDRLERLVPGYLKSLPGDPFAASGPLRYRRSDAAYVLYSVGPDGKDDGGRPIRNAGSGGFRSTLVQPDSTGDIVAGVNTGRGR